MYSGCHAPFFCRNDCLYGVEIIDSDKTFYYFINLLIAYLPFPTKSINIGSFVVLIMVQWVVRSILHGGPIELFLVPASAPQLYVLSCLWDGAYKKSANGKE